MCDIRTKKRIKITEVFVFSSHNEKSNYFTKAVFGSDIPNHARIKKLNVLTRPNKVIVSVTFKKMRVDSHGDVNFIIGKLCSIFEDVCKEELNK